MLHNRAAHVLGPAFAEATVDKLDISQHARAVASKDYVRRVLLYFHEGGGSARLDSNADSPCKPRLRRIYCLHNVLDERAPEPADAGSLGHCCWRPRRRLSFEMPMGLLLVVSRLLHIWRARILLHLAAVQFLAHG